MFTIKLIEEYSGKPATGRRVSIGFNGLFTGGVTKDQYTDEKGEVHFDYDPAEGTVYVDHQVKYEGRLEGRVLIYV